MQYVPFFMILIVNFPLHTVLHIKIQFEVNSALFVHTYNNLENYVHDVDIDPLHLDKLFQQGMNVIK